MLTLSELLEQLSVEEKNGRVELLRSEKIQGIQIRSEIRVIRSQLSTNNKVDVLSNIAVLQAQSAARDAQQESYLANAVSFQAKFERSRSLLLQEEILERQSTHLIYKNMLEAFNEITVSKIKEEMWYLSEFETATRREIFSEEHIEFKHLQDDSKSYSQSYEEMPVGLSSWHIKEIEDVQRDEIMDEETRERTELKRGLEHNLLHISLRQQSLRLGKELQIQGEKEKGFWVWMMEVREQTVRKRAILQVERLQWAKIQHNALKNLKRIQKRKEKAPLTQLIASVKEKSSVQDPSLAFIYHLCQVEKKVSHTREIQFTERKHQLKNEERQARELLLQSFVRERLDLQRTIRDLQMDMWSTIANQFMQRDETRTRSTLLHEEALERTSILMSQSIIQQTLQEFNVASKVMNEIKESSTVAHNRSLTPPHSKVGERLHKMVDKAGPGIASPPSTRRPLESGRHTFVVRRAERATNHRQQRTTANESSLAAEVGGLPPLTVSSRSLLTKHRHLQTLAAERMSTSAADSLPALSNLPICMTAAP